MPGLTTRLKIPWASLEDGADIEQATRPLAEALDTAMVVTSGSGALPAQPQPIGALFYRTTSGILYFSNGTDWLPLTFNQPGTIPTSTLALDGGIKQGMLGAEVVNNEVPIGGVIEWWRPQTNVPVPDGFEVCDGHSVTQHDFVNVSGAVTLPNLQNMFILGASTNKADTAVADQGNATTQGPGIRGTGGSNALKNLVHSHGVPGVDHLHLVTAPDHLHGPGTLYAADHSHSLNINTGAPINGEATRNAGTLSAVTGGHQHNTQGLTYGSGNLGVGGTTGPSDRILQSWSAAADRSLNTATNSTGWTADPGNDFRPQFYGLLRIMKVRRV